MELYIQSGGSTAYKQKKFYMNRNKRIAEASELLSTDTLTPIDFINRILYDDEYLSEGLTKFVDGAVTGDDESELIREIESEVSELLDDDTASNGIFERTLE
ncbi:PREDICTED: uncharacterized protein LOC108359116 isoform X2 [Rhagoletis zephyria]|uniref:uncharacterized protein LOC108359116 isoform X2 n=1 Tax=Rhagoletis zephyria TaxID=28612 RepID=UPI0008113725|nr:PREDICTED: uncharacterized protein LOC108359116 isoform X2 [Rhagoletis zephyria]